jgi:hypothetical protein
LFSRGAHDATATFDIGNPNLGIETAKSVEVALRRATGPLRFEVTGYYTKFNGFIFRRLNGNTCEDGVFDCSDVIAYEIATGKLSHVSVGPAGELGNSYSGDAAVSGDGQTVVFASTSWNLVKGDGPNDCGDDTCTDFLVSERNDVATLSPTPAPRPNGDVNCNGSVDTIDALAIQRSCSNCRKCRGRHKAPRFAAGQARPGPQRADFLPVHEVPGHSPRL